MASKTNRAVGVDIGGTGIKGAIVDLEQGVLKSDRIKVPTPKGAEPDDVLKAVKEVLDTLGVSDDRDVHLGVAESYAAYSAMERENLSWEEWAARLQWYYEYIQFLFSPDLIIVGGGVSKNADKFLPLLKIDTPIVAAVHRNNAGIVGAAALALD